MLYLASILGANSPTFYMAGKSKPPQRSVGYGVHHWLVLEHIFSWRLCIPTAFQQGHVGAMYSLMPNIFLPRHRHMKSYARMNLRRSMAAPEAGGSSCQAPATGTGNDSRIFPS